MMGRIVFNVKQKVKIKDNYWDICNELYRSGYGPSASTRKKMGELAGRIFTIKEVFETIDGDLIYLLENNRNETDGFAWNEVFLERMDGE